MGLGTIGWHMRHSLKEGGRIWQCVTQHMKDSSSWGALGQGTVSTPFTAGQHATIPEVNTELEPLDLHDFVGVFWVK